MQLAEEEMADRQAVVQKEVLVLFGKRRRPVTFSGDENAAKEYKSLMNASIEAFKDILDSGEGTSSSKSTHSCYFQIESEKWGGLINLSERVKDGAIIHNNVSR